MVDSTHGGRQAGRIRGNIGHLAGLDVARFLKSAATMVTRPTLNPAGVRPSPAPQKVAIVSASPDMLAMIEAMLDPGRYNLVFIESSAHAYSDIKHLQPNLVILCTRLEHMDGFQVLSMLKLDHDTRDIPVVTFTTEDESELQNGKTAGLTN